MGSRGADLVLDVGAMNLSSHLAQRSISAAGLLPGCRVCLIEAQRDGVGLVMPTGKRGSQCREGMVRGE
ncbi:hypothetical protein RRG08_059861 [Elysia crispata]|uniref:Uncharacterized protein n=1 Tax=Elysia crispata TaxID=231223 RepID=A0AAE1CR74_9GAST|nr:hypothetical protein RRG08_059861 [Elysia crispata]